MDNVKKLLEERRVVEAKFNSRRHFIKDCSLGLGGIALGSFLNSCSTESEKIPAYTADRSMNPNGVNARAFPSQGKKCHISSYGRCPFPIRVI